MIRIAKAKRGFKRISFYLLYVKSAGLIFHADVADLCFLTLFLNEICANLPKSAASA